MSETASKSEQAEKKPKATPAPKGGVKLGQYIVHDQAPLSKYDNGPIKAYKASHKKGREELFALICEEDLVPRHSKRSSYNKIINANLASIVAHGMVYWPPAKQERYIFLYEDVLGKKLIEPGQEMALGVKPDIVLENVVKPMVDILQDFRDKDFVHGSIRVDNLYDGGSTELKRIVLGDALTVPFGSLQPATYEPIERAMAQPIGRGEAMQDVDMYAFGVMLTVLLRHKDPMHGWETEDIILKKMEIGSYGALTAGDRFTGSILELLRGLLHDDPNQRWTLDEVLVWLGGRRLSPKQSLKRIMAPRPIVFFGKKYLSPPILAMNLAKNPEEVIRVVDDGVLKKWMVRAIEDPDLYERAEDAIMSSKQSRSTDGLGDRMASNLSMVLDPSAPIRYKELSMHVEGIGSALAQTCALKQDLQPFVELFTHNIVMNWVKGNISPSLDIGSLVTRFDSCRISIGQTKIGFGLERCLYILNSEVHCLSDKLQNYYVLNPEDVLFAYEDLCEKGKAPSVFIDRHIAAFIGVRDAKSIEGSLHDLSASEQYKKVIGALRCFGAMQKRHRLPSFPAIAMAFSDQMHVIYKRYHDKKVRESLKKNIVRYAQDGDLEKMSGLLDNLELKNKDLKAFKKSIAEYQNLSKEHEILKKKLENKSTFGLATGQEFAAIASCILSSIIVLFIAFLYFSDQAIF